MKTGKVEAENSLSRIFDTFKKYEAQETISELDMLSLINKAYLLLVEDSAKRFTQNVTSITNEDCCDFADISVDFSSMIITSMIREYSLDVSDAPYIVPEQKIMKLKKHLSRVVQRQGEFATEMYEMLALAFVVANWTPLRKATENRTKVLAEIQNAKNKN